MGKISRFFKTKGLLLAAGLCVVAAGVAGVNVVNRMIEGLGTKPDSAPQSLAGPDENAWEITETPVDKPQPGVPVTAPDSGDSRAESKSGKADSKAGQPVESTPPAENPVPGAEALPAPEVPRFARPVAGAVMADFSGNELLYNETMDDWRTHNGTDFAAVYGEKVVSITAGTVKAVAEDALWGWTVEVEGPEGLLRYAGLAHKPAVKAGQTVAVGDTLGKLDELCAEIALEPHLHVEYEKDGKLCDVMTLLAG